VSARPGAYITMASTAKWEVRESADEIEKRLKDARAIDVQVANGVRLLSLHEFSSGKLLLLNITEIESIYQGGF
jgi:uncharacterized protein YlzI (FlbEa/FlbD family)